MPNLNELEELGLNAMKDFWECGNGFIDSLSNKQLQFLIKKASLGMQFFKEINLGKRATERNTLRVCTLVANDKKELAELLKKSLPQYTIKVDKK